MKSFWFKNLGGQNGDPKRASPLEDFIYGLLSWGTYDSSKQDPRTALRVVVIAIPIIIILVLVLFILYN